MRRHHAIRTSRAYHLPVPDSEAAGDPVLDDSVDTDRTGARAPATRQQPGFHTVHGDGYDYLRADVAPGDRTRRRARELEYTPVAYGDGWEYPAPDSEPGRRPFDAFNDSTWHFKSPPPPWYRTRPAVMTIAAASVAAVTLVVSTVLLAFTGPADDSVPTHESTHESTSSAPATTNTSRSPLPPPPPPPPPPPSSEPAQSGGGGQRVEPRPTKKPEIGVTRTPVTRNPISVSPQPRGAR